MTEVGRVQQCWVLTYWPLDRVLDAAVLGFRVPETPCGPGLSPAASVSLGCFSCASSTSVFCCFEAPRPSLPEASLSPLLQPHCIRRPPAVYLL